MRSSKRKICLLAVAFMARAALVAHSAPLMLTQWDCGTVEVNEGWAEHAGDNLTWAQPGFDSSAWPAVDLEDMGPASTGWRWFRKRITVGANAPEVRLLLEAGVGTYELYVNGERIPGTAIKSPFAVTRPSEKVFVIPNQSGNFVFAVRTYTPPSYAAYHLPLFMSVTIGEPTAIGFEQEALESDRLYLALPSIFINVLLVLAGISAFGLFMSQRAHREYMFLGLYLLLVGFSTGFWIQQQAGVLPIATNLLFADPLLYFVSIVQIEFTFSFAGCRVSWPWRIYEAVLLVPLVLVIPLWVGWISSSFYLILEAIILAPVALLLPVLLWRWYRAGNREAGWLIFPSLLPAAAGALYDLGTASIFLDWHRFDFLDNPISIGRVPITTSDIASLLFLLAIGLVMFFRFTRVSRQQARAAAELDAAREIQQRLVPSSLPAVPGCRVEVAYLPAEEVGGDFYQLLNQSDGSALIVIGDVSGKGLKAAMTGALTIGALRTLAMEGLSPATLLTRLNREVLRAQSAGFITCLCASIEPGGAITFANAGHIPPYWNGEEVPLDPNLPLGISFEVEYAQTAIQLGRGDTLAFLSDGVVEARNPSGDLFGFERAAAISTEPAPKMAQAAQAFGQEDDITVLTLTVTPAMAPQTA
jgi:stage II sporulation SpoE-like protein